MITFNSQEEFEDAVMGVLANRLSIDVKTQRAGYYSGDGYDIHIKLIDSKSGYMGETLSSASTGLPQPRLDY